MNTQETTKTEEELSVEQFNADKATEIDAKIKALSERHNCDITPIVFKDPATKRIIAVGYLRAPSLEAEMAYMDIATRYPFSAGEQILDSCICKDDSDPRLFTRTNENREFYKGAVSVAGNMIQMYTNVFKKK